MEKFVSARVKKKNNVGKGANADYQHFLLFSHFKQLLPHTQSGENSILCGKELILCQIKFSSLHRMTTFKGGPSDLRTKSLQK